MMIIMIQAARARNMLSTEHRNQQHTDTNIIYGYHLLCVSDDRALALSVRTGSVSSRSSDVSTSDCVIENEASALHRHRHRHRRTVRECAFRPIIAFVLAFVCALAAQPTQKGVRVACVALAHARTHVKIV